MRRLRRSSLFDVGRPHDEGVAHLALDRRHRIKFVTVACRRVDNATGTTRPLTRRLPSRLRDRKNDVDGLPYRPRELHYTISPARHGNRTLAPSASPVQPSESESINEQRHRWRSGQLRLPAASPPLRARRLPRALSRARLAPTEFANQCGLPRSGADHLPPLTSPSAHFSRRTRRATAQPRRRGPSAKTDAPTWRQNNFSRDA